MPPIVNNVLVPDASEADAPVTDVVANVPPNVIQIVTLRLTASSGSQHTMTINTVDGNIVTAQLDPNPTLHQVIDALTSLL